MTGNEQLGVCSGEEDSKEDFEGGQAMAHLIQATRLPPRYGKLVHAQVEGYVDLCLALLEMTGKEMTNHRGHSPKVGKEKLPIQN